MYIILNTFPARRRLGPFDEPRRAGRVAIIQCDVLEAFRDLIRAATEDASLLGEVKPLLQKLVDPAATETTRL